MKNCSQGEGLTLEKFVEDCLQWLGSHTGVVEESNEKGASETICDEHNLHSLFPYTAEGEEAEKSELKLSLGRRKGEIKVF